MHQKDGQKKFSSLSIWQVSFNLGNHWHFGSGDCPVQYMFSSKPGLLTTLCQHHPPAVVREPKDETPNGVRRHMEEKQATLDGSNSAKLLVQCNCLGDSAETKYSRGRTKSWEIVNNFKLPSFRSFAMQQNKWSLFN